MAKMRIAKEMIIGDMVLKYPAAVGVLIENGFHCIGCAVSPYESLEQGAAVHGWSQQDLKRVIAEMEMAVKADIKLRADMEKKSKAKKASASKL